MLRRQKHAWHRSFGGSRDVKPVYSPRTKLLLILASLAISSALWYHVHTDASIDRATHTAPVEEDFEDFEDYGVCDMPGPCWGENPPVDCECH